MSIFKSSELFDWNPYITGTPLPVRSMDTIEGLGDRIRLVAFAERQATYAFIEASKIFVNDAPKELIIAWNRIALEEKKHESWLLKRLVELNQKVDEVPVSLGLFNSFASCKSARDFTLFISDSEERGRLGAIKFANNLKKRDPITAKIFADIAAEEVGHIALAKEYFSQD